MLPGPWVGKWLIVQDKLRELWNWSFDATLVYEKYYYFDVLSAKKNNYSVSSIACLTWINTWEHLVWSSHVLLGPSVARITLWYELLTDKWEVTPLAGLTALQDRHEIILPDTLHPTRSYIRCSVYKLFYKFERWKKIQVLWI